MFKVLFLCLLSYFVGSNGGPTAPFIVPCKIGDDACIISSAQAAIPYFAKGLPEFGVKPLDPVVLEDVKSDEGGLVIQFKNLHVAGPGDCNIIKASVAADMSQLSFDAECPITATGQYSVDGKLLIVPIQGAGDFEFKTEKIIFSVKVKLANVDGDDGKSHWHIVDYDYEYIPEERWYFRLDNLFNGNEESAKPVITVLNESWKEVITTIGQPIVKEIVKKVKEFIDNFLKAVPSNELYIHEKL